MQAGDSGLTQNFVGGKQTGEKSGKQQDHPPDHEGIPDTQPGEDGNGTAQAPVLHGTIVETQNRTCPVPDTAQRGLHDLADRSHDGHDRYIQIASIYSQSAVGNCLHKAVGDLHDERGCPQGQDPHNTVSCKTGFHPCHRESLCGIGSCQKPKDKQGRDNLGDHGCSSGTLYSPAGSKNEDRIQDDV